MSKWRNPTGHKINGKWRMLPLYNQWFDMYQRCTSKRSKSVRPTYENVTLCDEWYSYDSYCEWARSQVGFSLTDEAGNPFQLDKDLLSGIHYSPDTCVFLPKEVNTYLVKFKNSNGVSVTKFGKFRVCIYDCENKTTKHIACFDSRQDALECYSSLKHERAIHLREKWSGKIDQKAYEALGLLWNQ